MTEDKLPVGRITQLTNEPKYIAPAWALLERATRDAAPSKSEVDALLDEIIEALNSPVGERLAAVERVVMKYRPDYA